MMRGHRGTPRYITGAGPRTYLVLKGLSIINGNSQVCAVGLELFYSVFFFFFLWHILETVKTENDHINLKVAGQDGSVVQFKIKRHTPLSKLMKAYCDRQGLSMRHIRFRFDGQPINETDTPAQLEMEDEDTIDVFQQQTGGMC
ncbi:small ubiquitin-related modifier 3 isoform X1 [Hyla sarda]|uniref:small ubiquitin-related modifier 3 isoform X1 n=1 Tax=Hyla sarda TaxID=327740 RepID=UPI0024C2DC4A|nr:small ubiquitin-related modifier 3 isoform X1 [Hyla sarda]